MSNPDSERVDITWHPAAVSRDDRERQWRHQGCVVWFTGLSGSGKSTVANCLDQQLHAAGIHSFLLDGDNIRHGLNASAHQLRDEYGENYAGRFGLGFSAEDRTENIRRIGCVAQLFCAAGVVTLTAFVSPYRQDRERVRRYVEEAGRPGDFIEVFVDTPLAICEQRDPKGLYKKARAGELPGFTGIDDPYEPPANPALTLPGGTQPAMELAEQVLRYLRDRQLIG